MIGIKQKGGEFLDLYGNTQISFELNNPIFLGEDIENINGSYSFPFTIPASQTNQKILRYPTRIDNAKDFLQEESFEVYFCGKLLWNVKLFVKKPSNNQIRIYLIVKGVADIKNTKLNELDLDGDRTIPNIVDHAKDTTINPLDYDYVFFPVRNECFFDQDQNINANQNANIQNHWDGGTQSFFEGYEGLVAMPFIRLEYLLEKIFENSEIDFVNLFQTTDELKSICLYNNYSIYLQSFILASNPGYWNETINLQNHINDTSATDFLKAIMRNFCLGVTTDIFGTSVKLFPLKSLVSKVANKNWTDKTLNDYQICIDRDFVGIFCFAPTDDKLEEKFKFIDVKLTGSAATISDVVTPVDELQIWYIEDQEMFYSFTDNNRIIPIGYDHACYDTDCNDNTYESIVSATYAEVRSVIMPAVQVAGTLPTLEMRNDFPLKLMIYRGMYPNFNGTLFPLATPSIYDLDRNVIGEHSLLWKGRAGLFEKWWKEWHEMIKRTTQVDRSFCLELKDLFTFRFEDKIKVDNMDFFVKKMRITLTQKGLKPVPCTLVSVI